MDNPSVALTAQEWTQVMAILSTAPWRDANPLLMKIGEQLQRQMPGAVADPGTQQSGIRLDANGREIRNG
jgi:hypothetical protein